VCAEQEKCHPLPVSSELSGWPFKEREILQIITGHRGKRKVVRRSTCAMQCAWFLMFCSGFGYYRWAAATLFCLIIDRPLCSIKHFTSFVSGKNKIQQCAVSCDAEYRHTGIQGGGKYFKVCNSSSSYSRQCNDGKRRKKSTGATVKRRVIELSSTGFGQSINQFI